MGSLLYLYMVDRDLFSSGTSSSCGQGHRMEGRSQFCQ
jgi:hypothetical protein